MHEITPKEMGIYPKGTGYIGFSLILSDILMVVCQESLLMVVQISSPASSSKVYPHP